MSFSVTFPVKERQQRRVPNICESATLTFNNSWGQEIHPDTSPKFFLLTVSSIPDSVGREQLLTGLLCHTCSWRKKVPMPRFILLFSFKSNSSLEGFAFLQRTCSQTYSKSLPYFHTVLELWDFKAILIKWFCFMPGHACYAPFSPLPCKPHH